MGGTFERGEPALPCARPRGGFKAKNSGALSCDASTVEPPTPDPGARRKAYYHASQRQAAPARPVGSLPLVGQMVGDGARDPHADRSDQCCPGPPARPWPLGGHTMARSPRQPDTRARVACGISARCSGGPEVLSPLRPSRI